MSNTKVLLHMGAFRELRHSMDADLERRGQAVAQSAGPGYIAESAYEGKERARVTVKPVTIAARRDNARNHTLLRALDAGRD